MGKPRRERLFVGAIAVFALAATSLTASALPRSPDEPQCTAELQLPRRVRTVRAEVSASLQAGVDRLNQAQTSQLRSDFEAAANICREHVGSGNTRNLSAYLCVGQAALGMARLSGQDGDWMQAHCAFSGASRLADNRSMPATARAQAYEGHARTMEGIAARGGANGEFLARAVTDYNHAIAADTSPQPQALRYFSLGRLHLSQNRQSEAQAAINSGRALAPSGQETARALIELAEASASANGDTYEWAVQAYPSATTYAASGVSLFRRGQYAPARQRFELALGNAGPDLVIPNGRNYRADTLYYLSVLDARALLDSGASGAAWRGPYENASAAVQAGGSGFEHRRQICVAHIARGGASLRDEQGSLACELDNSPEGELLRGMYHLRRAQYLNPGNFLQGAARNRYLDAIRNASDAFARGLDGVSRMAGQQRQEIQALAWPTYAPAINVEHMLRYGKDIVARQCPLPEGTPRTDDVSAEVRTAGRPFFLRYRVLDCIAR